MERDFNQIINRKDTNSIKYDFAVERGKPEDVLPLWVADMDFQTPKAVVKKLEQLSGLGIYGYSEVKDSYFKALEHWYDTYFNWSVQKEWLVKTPGVVFAIAMSVRALTKEGEAVMIQRPVYYPFSEVIEANNRILVNSPLVLKDGRYQMNLKEFEEKIIKHQVRLFILCSPHNPVGRVWTKEELLEVGEICRRHGVFVVSDEIHGDFTYPGYQHTVFADLSKELEDITITSTAPSKTFNLAGLQVSNVFISNKEIREKVKLEITKAGYSQLNMMGLAACEAAYTDGRIWLEELKEYLVGNLDYLRQFLDSHLPEIKLIEPEGTYLVWLDFRAWKKGNEELERFMLEEAKLWVDMGVMFGPEGEGFARINIACPRQVLENALLQLEQAAPK